MPVVTVLGPVPVVKLGVTDAHNHVWIEPPPGAAPGLPRLDDQSTIIAELKDYSAAGGGAIVDCQPGGCGRDGNRLVELSRASGVQLIACTGFHRGRYYPPGTALFKMRAKSAAEYWESELTTGLAETLHSSVRARAGFIKVACEARLSDTPTELLVGAAEAARVTGAAVMAHTEKGAAVEDLLDFFHKQGLSGDRLVFCHVDKRPDPGLHRALAQAGVLLEYDTFYRPQYEPEKKVWPLLMRMIEQGYGSSIALATDMAESTFWKSYGGRPGLSALLLDIRPRLERLGVDRTTIGQLLGGNIAARLARPQL